MSNGLEFAAIASAEDTTGGQITAQDKRLVFKECRNLVIYFAALHGQDIDLGFPGLVGPLAAALGHEQMGDTERLELVGDAFSVIRLHADHGDVAEEGMPSQCGQMLSKWMFF